MSENILIMTIIGGTGSLFGSILGAGSIVLLGDLLSTVWPRWMILLGIALIAVVLFMPSGLWGGVGSIADRWREYRRAKASDAKSREVN